LDLRNYKTEIQQSSRKSQIANTYLVDRLTPWYYTDAVDDEILSLRERSWWNSILLRND